MPSSVSSLSSPRISEAIVTSKRLCLCSTQSAVCTFSSSFSIHGTYFSTQSFKEARKDFNPWYLEKTSSDKTLQSVWSQLSLHEHPQPAGHPAASPSCTQSARPRVVKTAYFFLCIITCSFPEITPISSFTEANMYKWQDSNSFWCKQTAPVSPPSASLSLGSARKCPERPLLPHCAALSVTFFAWSNHQVKVRSVVTSKICTISILIFHRSSGTPIFCSWISIVFC